MNGRAVVPSLHVEAVLELGVMMAYDDVPADAVREMANARGLAKSLPDGSPLKASFFRHSAPIALWAGYDGDGNEAAELAMKLLGPGTEKDVLSAEVCEARLLSGVNLT